MASGSAQEATTVLVHDTPEDADALLTPIEQLATAFYEDTRALLRATGLDLPAAFGAPLPYADDPELFLRLLAADVERLWQYRVVGTLALVLAAPAVPGVPQPVLYRGLYRLRPIVDPADEESRPRPIHRSVGRASDALGEHADVQACLIADWSRDPAMRKAQLVPPRYAFAWMVSGIARFDERTLAAADRFDPVSRPIRAGDEPRVLRLATQ
jgi:hypothetical protein